MIRVGLRKSVRKDEGKWGTGQGRLAVGPPQQRIEGAKSRRRILVVQPSIFPRCKAKWRGQRARGAGDGEADMSCVRPSPLRPYRLIKRPFSGRRDNWSVERTRVISSGDQFDFRTAAVGRRWSPDKRIT